MANSNYDTTDIASLLSSLRRKGLGNQKDNDKFKEMIKEAQKSINRLKHDSSTVNLNKMLMDLSSLKQKLIDSNKLTQNFSDKFDEVLNNVRKVSETMGEIQEAMTRLSNGAVEPFEKVFGFLTKNSIINAIISQKELKTKLAQIKSNLILSLSDAAKQGGFTLQVLGKNLMTAYKGYAKVFGEYAKMLAKSPGLIALAAVITLIVGSYKLFMRIQEVAAKFRTESGLTAKQAESLEISGLKIAKHYGQFGITIESALEATSALTKTFGSIDQVSEHITTTAAYMNSQLGTSADESAFLLRNLKSAGNLSDEMTSKFALGTAKMAEMANVAPTAVLKDMAQNAESLHTYFQGNVKEFAKAAVQLNKMNLSLKDAAHVADNLLEFDQSIEKELYAGVLLNKSLDFSRARMSAFEGDIAGATKEIINQVGDFNKLNVIQKKAISEATGLSTEQLSKSIAEEKVLSKMGKEKREQYQRALDYLNKAKDLDEAALMNDVKRQTQQQEMSAAWEKLSVSLQTIFLPMVNGLATLMSWVAKVFSVIADGINGIFGRADGMKSAGGWGEGGTSGLGVIGTILVGSLGFKFLKLLPKLLSNIAAPITKSFGQILSGIGNGIKNFFSTLGSIDFKKAGVAILMLVGLSSSLLILGLALKEFQQIDWSALAKAGVALIGLVATVAIIGAIMSSGVGAIAILAGAAAIAVIAGSLLLLGYAVKIAAPAFTELTDNIIKLGGMGTQLISVAAGITALGIAFATLGGGSILAGIGSFFSGDIFGKLHDLAGIANPLMVVASAITLLAASLKQLQNLDINKIGSISSELSKLKTSSLNIEVGSITTTPTVNTNGIKGTTYTGAGSSDLSEVSKKLDQLISILTNGFAVNIDGKRAGELIQAKTSKAGVS
jgi:hypothetical protein